MTAFVGVFVVVVVGGGGCWVIFRPLIACPSVASLNFVRFDCGFNVSFSWASGSR